MKAAFRVIAALLLALLVLPERSASAGPKLDGKVTGVELCIQSICGQAVFAFDFNGKINGWTRDGSGVVGVNHQSPLPGEGGTVGIIGGSGVIFSGWQPFFIEVKDGTITGATDGDANMVAEKFNVQVNLSIESFFGGPEKHCAKILLDHNTLPFEVSGGIKPGTCALP